MAATLEASVQQLDKLLKDLRGELDHGLSPRRVAMRSLGLSDAGVVKTPYSDDAIRIFGEMARQNGPDAAQAVHHLAIMHHARAMDREASDKPAEADADWALAHTFWKQLWDTPEFWKKLGSQTESVLLHGEITKNEAGKLHADFPVLLLSIHYDIAFEAGVKPARALAHIGMAQRAPYPEEALERTRRAAYDNHIKKIPAGIWQPDMLDPHEINTNGTQIIKKFLDLDPGYVPALSDMLRLQMRLIRAWHTEFSEKDSGSPEQKAVLLKIKGASKLREFFDMLVKSAARLDDDMRQKLIRWYSTMGEILCILDEEADAVGYYQQSGAAAEPGSDEQKEAHKNEVRALAIAARSKAQEEKPDAKSYCEKVRARTDLTSAASLIFAQALMLIEDFSGSRRYCDQTLALLATEKGHTAEEIAETKKDVADFLKIVANRESNAVFGKAQELIQNDKHSQALALLNNLAPSAQSSAFFYLRCQCHMELEHWQVARADLQKFKSMAVEKEEKAAAGRLEKEFAAIEKITSECGTMKAWRLRQDAVKACNDGKHDDAIRLLRNARSASKRVEPLSAFQIAGQPARLNLLNLNLSYIPSLTSDDDYDDQPCGFPSLDHDLSLVLTMAAGPKLAADRYGKGPLTAMKMLMCATRLDPTNAQAKEYLGLMAQNR